MAVWKALAILTLLSGAACRRAPADAREAAERGSAAELAAFLAADPALLDSAGLLTIAAAAGNHAAAAALVERGADLDRRDERGETALHVAARRGDTRLIAMLAGAGADWRIENAEGRTPLRVAVQAKQRRAEDELREIGTRRFRPKSARPTDPDASVTLPGEIAWTRTENGEEVREIWGARDVEQHLALLRWPPGYARAAHAHAEEMHYVVVQGTAAFAMSAGTTITVPPASALVLSRGRLHDERCVGGSPCVIVEHGYGGAAATAAPIPAALPAGVPQAVDLRKQVRPRPPQTVAAWSLWSEYDGETGMIVAYGKRFHEGPHYHPDGYYVFLLEGRVAWHVPGALEIGVPGSFARVPGRAVHEPECVGDDECLFFIVWDGDSTTVRVQR